MTVGRRSVADAYLQTISSVTTHAAGTTADAVPTFSFFVAVLSGRLKVFQGNDLGHRISFNKPKVTLRSTIIHVK